MKAKTREIPDDPRPYISPSELADRWHCSRSSVDRIALRAKLRRMYLGEGKNGIVRYIRKEVEAYEAAHSLKLKTAPQLPRPRKSPGEFH